MKQRREGGEQKKYKRKTSNLIATENEEWKRPSKLQDKQLGRGKPKIS